MSYGWGKKKNSKLSLASFKRVRHQGKNYYGVYRNSTKRAKGNFFSRKDLFWIKFKIAAVICRKMSLILHCWKCFSDALQSSNAVEASQFLWSINHFKSDGCVIFFQLLILEHFEAFVELPEESCFVSDNYRIHSACKESSKAFELWGEIMLRMPV